MWVKVPDPIIAECIAWQERLDWPRLVPAWAEIPGSDGKTYWYQYDDLTPALCEQATEFHIRKARAAIERWNLNQSARTARSAGRHIIWARIYRCRFINLMGRDPDESEMPFMQAPAPPEN